MAEPAPDQQMRLIASVYKRPVTVGVLLSSQTAHMEPTLRRSCHWQRPEPRSRTGRCRRRPHPQPEPTRGRDRAARSCRTAALYTPTSLRELLESTYRRRLPVIGFSAALVAAGTLASAFTDIEDTVVQLGSLVDQIAAGRLPAPRYPAFWRTAVNDSVARSLDVAVDEETRDDWERGHDAAPSAPRGGASPQGWSTLALVPAMLMFVAVNVSVYVVSLEEAKANVRERSHLIAAALAEGSRYGVISGNPALVEGTVRGLMQADASVVAVEVVDADRQALVTVRGSNADTDAVTTEVAIERRLHRGRPAGRQVRGRRCKRRSERTGP
jgi:hypothetical protein